MTFGTKTTTTTTATKIYVRMKYMLIPFLVGGITDAKINKTLHACAVMCYNRRHVKMIKINAKLQPLPKNNVETQSPSVTNSDFEISLKNIKI